MSTMYVKKQLGIRLAKRHIISRKASEANVNEAEGFGLRSESLSGSFRGQNPLRKLFGSKYHLDWVKIDDKKYTCTVLKVRVK